MNKFNKKYNFRIIKGRWYDEPQPPSCADCNYCHWDGCGGKFYEGIHTCKHPERYRFYTIKEDYLETCCEAFEARPPDDERENYEPLYESYRNVIKWHGHDDERFNPGRRGERR